MPIVIIVGGYLLVLGMLVWFNHRFWTMIHQKEQALYLRRNERGVISPGTHASTSPISRDPSSDSSQDNNQTDAKHAR
jgi:cytoskeletal protein RodZ